MCERGQTTAAATAGWGIVSADSRVVLEGSCLGNSSSTAAGAVVLCLAAGLAGALSSLLLTRYSSKLSGTRPVE